MDLPNTIEKLKKAVAADGVARVAADLGYSRNTICSVLAGACQVRTAAAVAERLAERERAQGGAK